MNKALYVYIYETRRRTDGSWWRVRNVV